MKVDLVPVKLNIIMRFFFGNRCIILYTVISRELNTVIIFTVITTRSCDVTTYSLLQRNSYDKMANADWKTKRTLFTRMRIIAIFSELILIKYLGFVSNLFRRGRPSYERN